MGITIHFEGQLKKGQLRTVLQRARRFATENNWALTNIPEKERSLSRVRDEDDWDYKGLTSGVEFYPDENCEPLRLEFDEDGYIQEYIKTQFSPTATHIAIVKLLRELEDCFTDLEVVDESDYWETNDVLSLENHFSRFFEVMVDEKRRNPRLSGPYRLENGRIADLLEN